MDNQYKYLLLEHESQVNRDRLIALINSLTDGFLAVDGKGAIEISNSVALDLLDANVLKGRPLVEQLRPIDDQGRVVDLGARMAQAPQGFEDNSWSIKHKDGEVIRIYAHFVPVRSQYGKNDDSGWLVILRNLRDSS
ncbi:MAG TPA: PAS domain-containing protein [Candidatus Saccharimonadales bacterium]|nr:PAS domain-containing protein [Candidatus Saccharimonadales bacterium]